MANTINFYKAGKCIKIRPIDIIFNRLGGTGGSIASNNGSRHVNVDIRQPLPSVIATRTVNRL